MTYTKSYTPVLRPFIYGPNRHYYRGFKSPSRYGSKNPIGTAFAVFVGFSRSMKSDYVPLFRTQFRTLVHVSYTNPYTKSQKTLLINMLLRPRK